MFELDENGKLCRTCNTLRDFQSAMGGSNPFTPTKIPPRATPSEFKEPPDSVELGNNTWTFLHSVAAYYPHLPSTQEQGEMKQFLKAVSHFYPCKTCASDFESYIESHEPTVESREQLSLWMCDAHNAVNTKLGKPTFNCKLWQQRWRDGWDDFLRSQK